MATAAYGVQNKGGQEGSERGAHSESVGLLGKGRGGPKRRHRRRVSGGWLKKTTMVTCMQLLGSSWSPERTKSSAEILQDVLPSDGDDGVHDNDGEAVVTA
ncbi:unnamed protein product [Triticum turgidum subsp. durum]|uniref:Uncharacterized protein n=1 Tax=Triticum turgidum subsp. durum TaxID=4567 RepID=A0A9R1NMX5_TRITD|nr:unnamed protein product [Triticum turgidum subsp. durum]